MQTGRVRFRTGLWLGLWLWTASAGAQSVGSEFQVNTYTTDEQSDPAVSVGSSGEFVVVWQSRGSGGNDDYGFSVQGQRHASDGSPQGPQFQVNSYTTYGQAGPAVAVMNDGDFAVVWGSGGTDPSGASIQGQRFASSGLAQGAEFTVNTHFFGNQNYPSAAAIGEGFVVVWQSRYAGADTSAEAIAGQRYASDGSPAGAEFLVNSFTTGYQLLPSVESASNGDFVVVWASIGSAGLDNLGHSIQGQRYASNGNTLGAQFEINTYITGAQTRPAVSVAGDGNFVVAWHSYGSSGSDSSAASIQARRFASDGNPLGQDFQVNSYTTGQQRLPSLAVWDQGSFLVSWYSDGSSGADTSSTAVLGQRYASDGSPLGGEFEVNTYTTSLQWQVAAAASESGDVVLVWESFGSSGTDDLLHSIQGQRMARRFPTGIPALPPLAIAFAVLLMAWLGGRRA